MSREAMQQALDALQYYGSHSSNCDYLVLLTSMPPQRKPCSCGLAANIAALRTALAEQPDSSVMANGLTEEQTNATASVAGLMPAAPVVLTNKEIIAIRTKKQTVQTHPWADSIAFARDILAAAIPPGHCVVKDEPVARMLTWRGPSHTPTPPRAARTYAEFPEDAALPANKEAYWENAEPLYAARPGGSNERD